MCVTRHAESQGDLPEPASIPSQAVAVQSNTYVQRPTTSRRLQGKTKTYIILPFSCSLLGVGKYLFLQGGWGHLADDNNTNSSGGRSSNALSPSLQSYLNANELSWVGGTGDNGSGGGGGWLPSRQRQRDPTAIYRAEIARIGRRFGLNNRVSGGGHSRTSSHTSANRQRVRSGYDGTLAQESENNIRKRRGMVPHRSYQVEGFLEQGLDGGVALTSNRHLGRRSGRRSIGLAPHSTENARYIVCMCLEP